MNQLTKREPLLALVISGSIVADAKGKFHQLLTDDYNGGTFNTEDGEVFHHRGSFDLRNSGDVAFRFTLDNANSPEKIEYFGTISSGGRHVHFTKIRTDESGNVRRVTDDLALGAAKD